MRSCSRAIYLSLCISNVVSTYASVQDTVSITPENAHQVILATLKVVKESFVQQTSLYALWLKTLQAFKRELSEVEQERADIFDNIREIVRDVPCYQNHSKAVLLRPSIEGILREFQKESDAKIEYLMSLVTYLTKELELLYMRYQTSTQQEKNRYQELMEHLVAVYVQHDHMMRAQTQFTQNLQEFADFLYTYMDIASEEMRDLEHFLFEDQES